MSQREIHLVEESCQELSEDHLGVALIKPGDSVIIKKSGAQTKSAHNKGGTTVELSSLNRRSVCSGIFCCYLESRRHKKIRLGRLA